MGMLGLEGAYYVWSGNFKVKILGATPLNAAIKAFKNFDLTKYKLGNKVLVGERGYIYFIWQFDSELVKDEASKENC